MTDDPDPKAVARMKHFDLLPPRLRNLLDNAPTPPNSKDTYRLCELRGEEDTIRLIKNNLRQRYGAIKGP